MGLSDCCRPEKTLLTTERQKKKKNRQEKGRRGGGGGGGLVFLVVISSLCCSCLIQTPAGLPQHQEKSHFYHAITWPRVRSERRHLVDVVKMLWHLSLLASLNHSLHFCLFTHYLWFFFSLSTHTHGAFSLPPLPLIWAFRSAFWNAPLLFPPQSCLFSSERHLQRRRSVQFCHISLSSLCVFVPECVCARVSLSLCVLTVCGPLQTGREISSTKALWLYNSCCGVILTAKERPLLSMAGVVGKGLHVQQLGFPCEGLRPP